MLTTAMLLMACGGDDTPAEPADPPATPPEADVEQSQPAPPAADEPAVVSPPEPRPEPPNTALVLLERAAELEHDGFWEAAAEARRLALSDESAPQIPSNQLGEAHLQHIRLLLQLAQPANAAVALAKLDQALAASPGATLDESRLALIRARVHTAIGDADTALQAIDTYLDMGGAARHAALLERARLLTAIGDLSSAIRDYKAVRIDPESTALDLESALLEGGLLLENDERYAEADEWYVALGTVSPWLSDDAFSLHRSGAVRLAQGDLAGATEAWTTLLVEYPWHWRAVEVYDGLIAAGVPVDPLVEGLYFYRQFRYDDARAVYTTLIASEPPLADAGVATYYLAAIDEDSDNANAAIEGYLAAVALNPAGPQADDALWWTARLFEADGAHTRARLAFERLASDYPASPYAAEAAMRVPLSRYRAGELSDAADGFLSLAASADSAVAQRASLWLGKSLDALGDASGAQAAFRAALEPDPHSYSALRAQAQLQLAPLSPQLRLDGIPLSVASEPPVADWLATLPGGTAPSASLADSEHWRAAVDLWAVGLERPAAARFRLALAETASPQEIYGAAQTFEQLGAMHLRLEAALRLLDLGKDGSRLTAPSQIMRWAYPRGWPELAMEAARHFQVDELLLYAMIRQESRFDPVAGSVAGALGLTQVIPNTGAEIARTLDDAGFETVLLFRPERSIRYGAAYLGAQLNNFDGAAWIALAAYNGGPASAAGWSQGAASFDPDVFYEQITFQETRAYVRLVLENYAWYQYIYRGAPTPTIVTSAAGETGTAASGG